MFQDAFVYVLPFFAGFILFELYMARKKNLKIYSAQECLGSVLCGLIYVVAKPGVQAVFYASYMFFSSGAQVFSLNVTDWWVWPLGFILTDFCYYWFHRLSHTTPALWALHSVHHQPRVMNMTASFRMSIIGNLPKAFFYLPMAILGIPLEVILFSEILSLAYQMPAHTRVIGRLPEFFEYVFVTPSAHRVHHGREKEYHDKNFGGVFLIWDHIFGTQKDEGSQISFGTDEVIATANPVKINYYPIRNWYRQVRTQLGGLLRT